MPFQNRIVEYGVKNADQFTANPANPRIHPQFQREVMKAALDSLGWLAPVIENKRTGYLIDGHERVMQALTDNAPVPFVIVDIDEDEEKQALATFDPITGLAQYDATQLDALLQEVNSDSPAIQQMLSQLATKVQLYSDDASSSDNQKNGVSQLSGLEYRVIIECESEMQQTELLERFEREGLKCQALIS